MNTDILGKGILSSVLGIMIYGATIVLIVSIL